MPNPAVIIATVAVVAISAVCAIIFSVSERPQKTSYGGGTGSNIYNRYSPPPSPSSSTRKRGNRRRSPSKRSNSPCQRKCVSCGESSFVEIEPCGCIQMCKSCFVAHLKTSDACPVCSGKIDGCSPPVSPFGKCINCRKFAKLFQVLHCNHSFCSSCFGKQMRDDEKCLECGEKIRGIKQEKNTRSCIICQEFKWLVQFQPCGHRSICQTDVHQYLKISDNECNNCGSKVTAVE